MKKCNIFGEEIKCWNCESTENVKQYYIDFGHSVHTIDWCDKCANLNNKDMKIIIQGP